MEKRNFNAEMLDEIARIPLNEKPRLLLHCCCGPCATAVIEKLLPHFEITLFYYNPNTYPESEYLKRFETLEKYAVDAGLHVGVIKAEYRPEEYFEAIKGFEDTSEGGARCSACIEMRLSATADYAAAHGFGYFASTLSVSPMKNQTVINEAGFRQEKRTGVKYLVNDFKKNDGYKRSVEISKEYGLYRQNYCGCEASLKGRLKNG